MQILFENKRYTDASEFEKILAGTGVFAEKWPIEHINPETLHIAQEVLPQIKTELDAFKTRFQYETEDVVCLSPTTLDLDKKLEAFKAPHYHTDDEVRLTLAGQGVFTIYPAPGAPSIEITVEAGDMIVVPADTMHAFWLTEKQSITAVRIFKTNPKWEAIYEWPSKKVCP